MSVLCVRFGYIYIHNMYVVFASSLHNKSRTKKNLLCIVFRYATRFFRTTRQFRTPTIPAGYTGGIRDYNIVGIRGCVTRVNYTYVRNGLKRCTL